MCGVPCGSRSQPDVEATSDLDSIVSIAQLLKTHAWVFKVVYVSLAICAPWKLHEAMKGALATRLNLSMLVKIAVVPVPHPNYVDPQI